MSTEKRIDKVLQFDEDDKINGQHYYLNKEVECLRRIDYYPTITKDNNTLNTFAMFFRKVFYRKHNIPK